MNMCSYRQFLYVFWLNGLHTEKIHTDIAEHNEGNIFGLGKHKTDPSMRGALDSSSVPVFPNLLQKFLLSQI